MSAQFSGAKRRPTRQKNGPANPEKNPRELWVGLARRADLRIFVKKTAPPVFVIPAVLGSHPQSFRTFPKISQNAKIRWTYPLHKKHFGLVENIETL